MALWGNPGVAGTMSNSCCVASTANEDKRNYRKQYNNNQPTQERIKQEQQRSAVTEIATANQEGGDKYKATYPATVLAALANMQGLPKAPATAYFKNSENNNQPALAEQQYTLHLHWQQRSECRQTATAKINILKITTNWR